MDVSFAIDELGSSGPAGAFNPDSFFDLNIFFNGENVESSTATAEALASVLDNGLPLNASSGKLNEKNEVLNYSDDDGIENSFNALFGLCESDINEQKEIKAKEEAPMLYQIEARFEPVKSGDESENELAAVNPNEICYYHPNNAMPEAVTPLQAEDNADSDVDDYVPPEAPAPKRKRNASKVVAKRGKSAKSKVAKTEGPKRAKRPKAATREEANERKKPQNRDASARYRQKIQQAFADAQKLEEEQIKRQKDLKNEYDQVAAEMLELLKVVPAEVFEVWEIQRRRL